MRLKESYRTKAADLARDMLGLAEKHAAGREAVAERMEENAGTEAQARRQIDVDSE